MIKSHHLIGGAAGQTPPPHYTFYKAERICLFTGSSCTNWRKTIQTFRRRKMMMITEPKPLQDMKSMEAVGSTPPDPPGWSGFYQSWIMTSVGGALTASVGTVDGEVFMVQSSHYVTLHLSRSLGFTDFRIILILFGFVFSVFRCCAVAWLWLYHVISDQTSSQIPSAAL